MIVLITIFSLGSKKGGKGFRYPIHSSFCIWFKVETFGLQRNTESCRSWDHTLQMGWGHPDIQGQGGNGEFLAPRPVVRPQGLCSALFPPVLSALVPTARANNRNVPARKSESPNLFNELLLQVLSFYPTSEYKQRGAVPCCCCQMQL